MLVYVPQDKLALAVCRISVQHRASKREATDDPLPGSDAVPSWLIYDVSHSAMRNLSRFFPVIHAGSRPMPLQAPGRRVSVLRCRLLLHRTALALYTEIYRRQRIRCHDLFDLPPRSATTSSKRLGRPRALTSTTLSSTPCWLRSAVLSICGRQSLWMSIGEKLALLRALFLTRTGWVSSLATTFLKRRRDYAEFGP